MAKKKKSKKKNPIFDSIRKAVPPHSFKLKNKKRAKKSDTVGRKEKHKNKGA